MKVFRVLVALVVLACVAWIGLIWWVYERGEGTDLRPTEAEMAAETVEIVPLRDGLYALHGSGGAVTVLASDDGILLVDTDEKWMYDRIWSAITSFADGRVIYVINTHFHGDHVGSNDTFRAQGAQVIAHVNARNTILERLGDFTVEQVPEVVVLDGHELEFGGQKITLHHAPFAHTDGDLLVRFQPANVIAVGDVYISRGTPYLDEATGGNLEGHLAGMDLITTMSDEDTILVAGHGPVGDKADLLDTRAWMGKVAGYIRWLKDVGVPERRMHFFHPAFAVPYEDRLGRGWEKFWVRLVYRTLP